MIWHLLVILALINLAAVVWFLGLAMWDARGGARGHDNVMADPREGD